MRETWVVIFSSELGHMDVKLLKYARDRNETMQVVLRELGNVRMNRSCCYKWESVEEEVHENDREEWFTSGMGDEKGWEESK
ncbi:hypothetical protein E2C01_035620 [Portunus trituberculatus]|uniref:Uncharacterized protein n=1 Tax=Portunus trituberculatus TaxID=210409 RepID=A0A5B7FA88_PORTR|nr:hypothetical protein [Portunus trituberculatus]